MFLCMWAALAASLTVCERDVVCVRVCVGSASCSTDCMRERKTVCARLLCVWVALEAVCVCGRYRLCVCKFMCELVALAAPPTVCVRERESMCVCVCACSTDCSSDYVCV